MTKPPGLGPKNLALIFKLAVELLPAGWSVALDGPQRLTFTTGGSEIVVYLPDGERPTLVDFAGWHPHAIGRELAAGGEALAVILSTVATLNMAIGAPHWGDGNEEAR